MLFIFNGHTIIPLLGRKSIFTAFTPSELPRTWEEAELFTWDELSTYTWDELNT